MAWTKTSEGKDKSYAVYSETLATSLRVNATPTNWTSVIDFIPPGTDFTVIANSSIANMSASSGVQLFVSYSSGAAIANRYQVKETPFISDTSQIDNAAKVLYRDVSARGQYPYYWLKVPGGGGGNTAAGNCTMKVIVGKNQESII